MTQRRQFLIQAPLGLLAVAGVTHADVPQDTPPASAPPGAPPTFGATPGFGPEITPATFAEAEKLMQVTLTPAQRQMAAASWRVSLASTTERRTGPRKVALEANVAPGTVWFPVQAAGGAKPVRGAGTTARFMRSRAAVLPLPARDEDIAFAPVTVLSRWIETRKLTSERLTKIYIDRIHRLDPRLRCVITLTEKEALARARQADREIAADKYRGALHASRTA